MHLELGPLHASAVSFKDQGVLILGPSGSGKSSLALGLMSQGAVLICDDRIDLHLDDAGRPWLRRPSTAIAAIEARGVGLLRAESVASAPLCLVVDLLTPETDRLPPRRSAAIRDVKVPLFHNVTTPTFPMAIVQYLLHGRHDPDA